MNKWRHWIFWLLPLLMISPASSQPVTPGDPSKTAEAREENTISEPTLAALFNKVQTIINADFHIRQNISELRRARDCPVVIGDLNGDNHLDVVMPFRYQMKGDDFASHLYAIFINRGDNRFDFRGFSARFMLEEDDAAPPFLITLKELKDGVLYGTERRGDKTLDERYFYRASSYFYPIQAEYRRVEETILEKLRGKNLYVAYQGMPYRDLVKLFGEPTKIKRENEQLLVTFDKDKIFRSYYVELNDESPLEVYFLGSIPKGTYFFLPRLVITDHTREDEFVAHADTDPRFSYSKEVIGDETFYYINHAATYVFKDKVLVRYMRMDEALSSWWTE